MKVTSLGHAGFLVEMQRCVLIFDWWTGELPQADFSKQVIVFVSHRHEDHYDPRIFSLSQSCCSLTYVLDSGISIPAAAKGRQILSVSSGREYQVGDVTIRTFKSTDEGVAFLVQTEGKSIFHAGDLNLWLWPDDTAEESAAMQQAYISQLKDLKRTLDGKTLDAAFIPFDPRLKEHTPDGLVCFLQQIPVRKVWIMHYWSYRRRVEKYLECEALRPYSDIIQARL